MEDRLKWIQKIHPDFKESSWMYEKVIKERDIEHYKFYRKGLSYELEINPRNIKGIEYQDAYNSYYEINWIDLLKELKRLDRIIKNCNTRAEVLELIKNDNIERKSVRKYGEILITTMGQHRLCLSKFLDIERVNVFVDQYELDQERLNIYNLLKKYKDIFNQFGLKLNSEDDFFIHSGYQTLYIEANKCSLRLHVNLIEEFALKYKCLKTNFLQKVASYFQFLFHSNDNIQINSINDLNKYSFLLLLNKVEHSK